MSDLLYTVFTNIAPQVEDEFNVWQETEHGPYLITLPGYQNVTRYKDCDVPHRYANFWHISSMADFDNPERLVRAKTPWGNYLSPFRDRRIDFYIQDGGIGETPPAAELDECFEILIMDSYLDEDDLTNSITKAYREKLSELKKLPNVLDVKIFHAYEHRGIEENCVFYYLSGTLQEAEKTVLPKIDSLLGDVKKKVKRTRMECCSQNCKVKAAFCK